MSREIIRGQVTALRRSFQWPVITLVVLLFLPALVHLSAVRAWSSPELETAAIWPLMGGISCLRTVADCYAAVAFGMWLALTLKKPGLASSLTVLFVLVLPSMLCVLDVVADLFFILRVMSKLRQQDLRLVVARQLEGGRARALAGTVAATPGRPPVIAG